MNKFIFIVLFLLVSACNKPEPAFNALSSDALILAFGDSLTYGTGATKNTNYPAILSNLSKHEVINVGIPGEISANGLKRLPALLDQYQPELLILIHGGNDILRKIPAQQTQLNLTQMIDEARQREIKVVMLGVPTPSIFFMQSAEFYQQVANDTGTPIDMDTLPEILSSNHLKYDTIHPNAEGYKLMAENIYTLLQTLGAL